MVRSPVPLGLIFVADVPLQGMADLWDRGSQVWSNTSVWVMTGGDARSLEDLQTKKV